ncbi:hypothetical protein [Rhodospira trueperi]|nr:hypothetical protein [Rhodospira trueperi]
MSDHPESQTDSRESAGRRQPIVLGRIVAILTAAAMPFCGYAIYLDSPYVSGLGVVVALSLVGLSLALCLLMIANIAEKR